MVADSVCRLANFRLATAGYKQLRESVLAVTARPTATAIVKITQTDWEGSMKRFAAVCVLAALGFGAFALYNKSAPASAINKFQVSQINVSELMSNANGLIDTTPAEPY
jgi:hypothetical protein